MSIGYVEAGASKGLIYRFELQAIRGTRLGDFSQDVKLFAGVLDIFGLRLREKKGGAAK